MSIDDGWSQLSTKRCLFYYCLECEIKADESGRDNLASFCPQISQIILIRRVEAEQLPDVCGICGQLPIDSGKAPSIHQVSANCGSRGAIQGVGFTPVEGF